MCGSACLPGGGAAFPALPLTAPTLRGLRGPVPPPRGGHGRSWGGARVRISEERRDRTGRCWFASCHPPPCVNTAPNSCGLAGASTPASSLLGARGFPGWGCRERSALPPPLFYKPNLETKSWTHSSPALGGKESTAEPPPQPIPNETRTLSPQNPVCIPSSHLWSLRSSKLSPTSLFGVHSKFRTVPGSRSPTVSRWPGAFWYQPRWAPSSLPAALAPVSGCSGRLPPAQFLPPDSARRDGAGLVSLTKGAPDLSQLSFYKGFPSAVG